MIVTESLYTRDGVDGPSDSTFVKYTGDSIRELEIRRSLLDQPTPRTLVVHVSFESKRVGSE